ncbi:hypothetical protein DL93DRAFT_2165614 [Clavulina sp. PMI_390]|nr:hypothetical protein DL93DRAFT_2165614 [Clavulina sp. PMI_390]
MKRREPPPALSLLSPPRARELRGPPSPAPYTPSVYSEYGRPSGESSHSDMQISSAAREAWNDLVDQQMISQSADADDASGLDEDADADENDEGAGSRLSVMGPKMKVLSKAPWEAGGAEDSVQEEFEAVADDTSDAASVFGKSLGRRSRDRSRTVTTPTTPSKMASYQAESEGKGWMPFASRGPRQRVDSALKDMISGPVNVVSSTTDYVSSAASSPVQANFQYAAFSPTTTSSSGSHRRPRAASKPRSDSTVSTYTTASSYSSSKHPAAVSPLSDRFPSNTPLNRSLPPSNSHPGGSTPVSFPSTRSDSPNTVESTPKSSEDGVHPFANPEVVKEASSPRPYPNAQFIKPSLPSASTSSLSISSPASTPRTLAGPSPLYAHSESTSTLAPSVTMAALANLTISTSTTMTSSASPSLSSVAFPTSPSMPRPMGGNDMVNGMHLYPGSPAYNLISLEQAQEKKRVQGNLGHSPTESNNALSTPMMPVSSAATIIGARRNAGGHLSVPSVDRTIPNQRALSTPTPVSIPIGESPPLPALPSPSPPSPSSHHAPPVPTPLATSTSNPNPPPKVLKGKRSGFLKMFGVGDKDKSSRSQIPDGFVHVAGGGGGGIPRSFSFSSESLPISGDEASPIDGPGAIPPTPAIPAQYRAQRDGPLSKSLNAKPSNSFGTVSTTSLESSQSSSLRGRGGFTASTPSPTASPAPARQRADSLVTPGSNAKSSLASKIGWGGRNTNARGATLDVPTIEQPSPPSPAGAGSTRDEFQGLQIRPMSSLFSNGLPMDLMLDNPSVLAAVMEEGASEGMGDSLAPNSKGKNGQMLRTTGFGPRRRPELGIGIPTLTESPASASTDLHSPSSLTSSFSGGRGSAGTSTSGPATPSSAGSSQLHPHPYPTSATSSTATLTPHQQQQHPDSVHVLQARIVQERKAWQLQRWEYEAQIRELEQQLAEARGVPCRECGVSPLAAEQKRKEALISPAGGVSSIIDRPRMRNAPHYGVAISSGHVSPLEPTPTAV